ncbi:uncharacterized protein [Halyomorpha halys]|uniref:uncharacterized protein n=1 Tax=Halyomorpha halys TaxID=286706 RepID=UPI0006D5153B|nr:uncharacterized protein LOC106687996 [Halyomorpha halys]
MERDEEDLIIACCLYQILQEEQRKKKRKRKKQWIDNLKRARDRRLSRKLPIYFKNFRRNQHLGRPREPVKVLDNSDPLKDPNNATYCDEKENFETSKNIGITIKVEPGLTDGMYQDDTSKYDTKDFLPGCSQLKEEENSDSMNEEHLDSMIDVDNTTLIKQEDESYPTSPHTDVKIKIEPDLSEDDTSYDYI